MSPPTARWTRSNPPRCSRRQRALHPLKTAPSQGLANRRMQFACGAQRGSAARGQALESGWNFGGLEGMTSVWRRVGLGVGIGAARSALGRAPSSTRPAAPRRPARHRRASAPHRVAPAYIRDRVDSLGRAFDGRVGIAVQSIDDGLDDRLEGRRALSAAERQQILGGDHRAGCRRQGPGAPRRPGHPGAQRPHPVPPADRRARSSAAAIRPRSAT